MLRARAAALGLLVNDSLMSMPLVRVMRVVLSLAVVLTFVSFTRTARAEGKSGESTARVLAAESSPSAPTRAGKQLGAKATKATPAKTKKARPAAKGKAHGGHVKAANAKSKSKKPAGGKHAPPRKDPKLRA